MSLRSFLYAVEAVRAEEGIRFVAEDSTPAPAPSPADVKNQNAQSMAALAGILGGVQKGKR